MTEHRQRMHRTEPSIDWNRLPVSQTEHHPQFYDLIFPRTTKRCPFPFTGCPGSSFTWNGLRYHFNRQHWGEQNQDPRGAPKPLSQVRALSQPSPLGESEHPSLCVRKLQTVRGVTDLTRYPTEIL